ncbi:MAG: hypothetical protein C3F02_00635 [Parcubacteria group bacterium]|nr:MAG: hypothetical protein C3F02_00635 [Parcubacteria group bacterium]
MTLTSQRKGEIALAAIKLQVQREGIRNFKPRAMRRRMGEFAKLTGFSVDELEQFFREMFQEVLDETLAK